MQIVVLNKIIASFSWQEIEVIEVVSIMTNPALRIKIINGGEFQLYKKNK